MEKLAPLSISTLEWSIMFQMKFTPTDVGIIEASGIRLVGGGLFS